MILLLSQLKFQRSTALFALFQRLLGLPQLRTSGRVGYHILGEISNTIPEQQKQMQPI